MRRTILSAAAPACLLIGLTPVAAAADAAPAGNASATAAQVTNLVGISTTGATADPNQAGAHAAVINLGGQPALGTGGAQTTEGQSGGALLDTGTALPARVQVAPWHAAAKGSPSSAKRSSRASAALARLEAPGLAKLGVLASDAQADHQTSQSTALSTSDAVDLSLGDIARIVLLHSEVGSSGKGHSYLVGLSGTQIGTDDQLGKGCALDASGVASLSCLTASGGVANNITSGAAEIIGVKTALGLDPVSAFTTAASSGTGTPSILPSVAAPALPSIDTSRALNPAAAATTTTNAAALPRTGVAALSMAVSALAALLSGLGLRLLGRRRVAA
ncbi:MAG: hypothetical protein QOJ23_4187 [Actinomycetota bacterium]|nr:hypothetical protein [Actinomycetota bacterium]